MSWPPHLSQSKLAPGNQGGGSSQGWSALASSNFVTVWISPLKFPISHF